jgi:peptidyl-prolyl cis-trans isomerase A (cyclophilin A)
MRTILLTVTMCAAAMAQTPATKAPATASKTGTSKTGATASKTGATKAPAAAACNLLDPTTCKATAPAVFKAKFTTTKGDIIIEVHRDWAPRGADRFYNLVRGGFFTDAYFFRAIPGFMAQFGVSSDPKVSRAWRDANIIDDPVKQSNTRGFVSFAQTGAPNTRGTQLFINYGDNSRLDPPPNNFAPIGQVVEGMEVADQFYSGYNAQFGGDSGQLQGPLGQEGKAFIESKFPKLDRILRASIIPATPAATDATKTGATKTGTSKTGTTTKAPPAKQ